MSVRYGVRARWAAGRGDTADMSTAGHSIARLGLVAKGTLYALLTVLAAQIAFGNGAEADSQGALRAIAGKPLGSVILSVLALGFAGYAGWQAHAAWTADEWRERLPPIGRCAVWAALSTSAVRFLMRAGTPPNSEESLTARLLDLPPGQLLVGALGLAVVAIGVSFLRHLRDHRYIDSLRPLPARTRRIVKVVTVTGITAKAGVYALAGAFLVRAAVRHQPGAGVGLDGALSAVAREAYGTYVLVAVTGGLAAYAVWCWVRARYENIEESNG